MKEQAQEALSLVQELASRSDNEDLTERDFQGAVDILEELIININNHSEQLKDLAKEVA